MIQSGAITKTAVGLLSYSHASAWPSLVSLARSLTSSLLQKIRVGQLSITDCNGATKLYGIAPQKDDSTITVHSIPNVSVHVLKDTFWLRLMLYGDMGFAESYMLGEITCNDLTSFFKLFILNRSHLSNGSTFLSSMYSRLAGVLRKTNTLTNARLHIAAHYDISNAMFEAFLSPDMTYSCAIFSPRSDPRHVQETLESAQERKLQRFIDNAKIQESDHVLEIGTGWGSFAMQAVRKTGCRVTSLTLSIEQKALAEERIAKAGLSDRIQVLLCDYRALPVPAADKLYDKVVSIEMLEAVGEKFLTTYFACVDRLLKKDGGIAVFQCITMPENRYKEYNSSDDFIRRYIFPGGHLPSITSLVDACFVGAKKTLIPETIENIGPHYAKTLRLWRERFLSNFDSQIKPALLSESTTTTSGKRWTDADVAIFRHKWEYYFCYCEAGFATKTLGDVILTFGREGAVNMMEDVPL